METGWRGPTESFGCRAPSCSAVTFARLPWISWAIPTFLPGFLRGYLLQEAFHCLLCWEETIPLCSCDMLFFLLLDPKGILFYTMINNKLQEVWLKWYYLLPFGAQC